ncbi:hypothetical protein [Streptomyces sp. NPDC004230]
MLNDHLEDDLEPDNDEELYRNPVYYEPAGRNLDLDRHDLGVPEVPGLLEKLLRMRGRVPVDRRGLICPDCLSLRNRRVPMYLVQRDGVWLASHYRKPGEKRITHESDEHLARKERVAKDSEDHGFRADMEATAADGHARLDVRIEGADGIILGYEPQLSPQTVRAMRLREGFRRRANIRSVWDFADPDHDGVGRVPYVRTPNLPASVIRVQKNPIQVRDGNFVLEEGHCSPGGAIVRCPEKAYDPANPIADAYCGQWHRVLVPEHQSSSAYEEGKPPLTLTRFIVEAAAGERIPFQRDGQHGWLPSEQWELYVAANGPERAAKETKASVRNGDRRDLCTVDRPASDVRSEPKERHVSRSIVLETRIAQPKEVEAAVDAAGQAIPPCHICGTPASLWNRDGKPEHWSCSQRKAQSPEAGR